MIENEEIVKNNADKTNLKLFIVSIIFCVFAVVFNNITIAYETINNNFIIEVRGYFKYDTYFIDYLVSSLYLLPTIALLVIVIVSKNKKPMLLAIPIIIYITAIVIMLIFMKVALGESIAQFLRYNWVDLVIYVILAVMIIVTFANKKFTKLPLIIYCFLMIVIGGVLLAVATMPYGMTVTNTEGKVIKYFSIKRL